MPRITLHNELIPYDEAKKILLKTFSSPLASKIVPTTHASGYVLSKPVYSNRTNPPVLLSGPDGIAVKSIETSDAGQQNPVIVNAVKVNTGMPMPGGFDAVIRIEDVTKVGNLQYRINSPVMAFQNTVSEGSDIKKGEVIMEAGHLINPFDIGALLSYGVFEVTVRDIKVGMIATGDEVIPLRKNPLPGQIVDTNSHMIAAYLKEMRITPVFGQITQDEPASITEELNKMTRSCDMVLVFGGSSAGSKDFTVDAIENGGELIFHGVGMAPGKPVSLGKINGKPVFGMPGPSIGSFIVFHELIIPLLKSWELPMSPEIYKEGELTETIDPFPGFDLHLMMHVSDNNGKTLIKPVPRIFGHMMGVRANSIFTCKDGKDQILKGSRIVVKMIRSN